MASVLEKSSRILLRRPTVRDAPEFTRLMRLSRKLHRPWVQPPTDEDGFSTYLERIRKPTHDGFLGCRREDGAIAGIVNLNEIVRGGFQSAYLGYQGVAPHANQGYMTETLDLVLRHAFTEMKLHRLEANIQTGNSASIALLRRCGFVREGFSRRDLTIRGRWRDHERWVILAEEWPSGVGRTTEPL